jgi:MarR family transcriptional regulator for hemolysin
MTRAQWSVLARLERNEGLKQTELADMLDLQPITLTRLVDRLCEIRLVERRPDPDDRRAKRLFLTAQAKPVMDRLDALAKSMLADVLEGIDAADIKAAVGTLNAVKENLRRLLQNKSQSDAKGVSRYG